MPSSRRSLSVDDARRHVSEACLVAEDPPLVGVELEWLTQTTAGPDGRLDPSTLAARPTGMLPAGSRLTFEPGGQLEVSAPPHPDIDSACAAAASDLATARAGVALSGVALVGAGADPHRAPRRMVKSPRYDAMEAYFDAGLSPSGFPGGRRSRLGEDPNGLRGRAGRLMMCNTASVQVNVGLAPGGPRLGDGGPEGEAGWRLANRLGPTLAAAFANSPLTGGTPSGWKSFRLAAWAAIDRSRTDPVPLGAPVAESWADYALDARVMLIRDQRGGCRPVCEPFTFGEWLALGHDEGYPTLDDLEYHLSTLFPPVRPRRWLELRMIDALPDPWWQVPVAVVTAVLWDNEAGEEAARACAGTEALWSEAARLGLGHPALAASARGVFAAAQSALTRLGVSRGVAALAADFADRYVDRGRCPADDRLHPPAGPSDLGLAIHDWAVVDGAGNGSGSSERNGSGHGHRLNTGVGRAPGSVQTPVGRSL